MPSLLRNKDGRFEFFAIGGNWGLYHTWQVAPNGAWSGWHSLGGQNKQITAGRNADGRLEVFAIGSDNALYHIWQVSPGGGWSSWASLGGYVKQIVVASNQDGRLEVFAIGSDNALYHIWQDSSSNAGWSGWEDLHGFAEQITVGSNADGRLEVFAVDNYKNAFHLYQFQPNSGWSGWDPLLDIDHNGSVRDISVVRNTSGELRFYWVNDTTGEIWETFQSPQGGWTPGTSLSDGNSYQYALAAETKDGIELIIIGTDDKFYKRELKSQSGSWSPRAAITLPSIPNENVLPPGGMRGFSNMSTLPDASFFDSPIPSTPQERINDIIQFRAACFGVVFYSAATAQPEGVGAGLLCALTAQGLLYLEEDKIGQHESPSGDSEPTPSDTEMQQGGTEKEPDEIHDADPSPPSRDDMGD